MAKKKDSTSRLLIHIDELPKDEAAGARATFATIIEKALRRHPDDCVDWARAGDWQLLATYVKIGGSLNVDSVRQIFADLIQKKLKRPDSQLGPGWRSLAGALRANAVRYLVTTHGINKTKAVSMVAEAHEVTEKTIWNDIRGRWDESEWHSEANDDDYLVGYPS